MIDIDRIRFLTAVRWHLNYNFYPHMNHMLDQAIEALDNCNNYEPDKLVTFPSGRQLPSAEIIEILRLEDMITAYF